MHQVPDLRATAGTTSVDSRSDYNGLSGYLR